MYFDYLNVLVFSAVGLAFVFATMVLGTILRPKRKQDQGLEIYECGELPFGQAWVRWDIRFYTVALVYLVFAIEIAFLFPVMVVIGDVLRDQGAAAGSGIGYVSLLHVLVFVIVLFMGLVSVWAMGDLDWITTYDQPDYNPPSRELVIPLIDAPAAAAGVPEKTGEKPEGDEGSAA